MEKNIRDVIHFMKAVENPEWMVDLVEDLVKENEEIKKLEIEEKKWLLKGNVRNRLIQLNENIDSLIDVAHETYMVTSETDVENRARLDAQIQSYWNVKSMIEDILEIK